MPMVGLIGTTVLGTSAPLVGTATLCVGVLVIASFVLAQFLHYWFK